MAKQRGALSHVAGDRVLREGDRAPGCGPLGCGVGQLERLLDGQVLEPLDLDDAAAENVVLGPGVQRELALLRARTGWRAPGPAR